MKNIFLVIIFFIFMFVLSVSDYHGTRKYDCGMAEWHPDIPKEVKDECRKMHKEDWDRIQNESKKKLIST